MPSKWRYFCCTCYTEDKHRYKKPYSRVKVRRRTKNASGNKSTWTRKSLLDNEHAGITDTNFDQIASHTQSDDFHGPDSTEYSVTEMNTFDNLNKHKRKTAKEVFEHVHRQGPAETQTTFPWMNEEFVPNGRNGPHLGISSVQINARRNEQAIKNISPDFRQDISSRSGLPKNAYLKSRSFSDGESRGYVAYAKPMIRTNVALNNERSTPNGYYGNVRTVPNGYGFRGNVTTAMNKANTVAAPAGKSDRPLILHAPHSDVGVRVVHTNSRAKDHQIPRLGEYMVLKPDSRPTGNKVHVSHAPPGGQSVGPISYKPLVENQSDTSFSSEVTFRKSDPGYNSSEMSLKRSKQPTIFSNESKYQRLKNGSDTTIPYNTTHVRGPKVHLDSMYGYVPKAVQNVHASNALSGGKIDDFFMQRMGDKELEKFASLDRKETKDWRDVMEENYIGTQPARARPKSVPAFITMDRGHLVANGETGVSIHPHDKNDYAQIKIGLQQIKLQPPPQWNESNIRTFHATQAGQQTTGHNSTNANMQRGKDMKNENEEKVIMIDFPPNQEKDKQRYHAYPKPNIANESNDKHFSSAKEQGKLMVNPLPETEHVLY